MKITWSETKLVITDFPWLFVIFLLIPGVGFPIHTAFIYAHRHVPDRDSIIGTAIALLFLLIVMAIAQRSVFSFDRATRELTWSRSSVFGRKGGVVPFYQIKAAAVESSADSKGGMTYRVSLQLTNEELPLTFMYTGGGGPKDATICHEINAMLGVAVEVETRQEEADIRALVDSGRLIDAIARVRQMRKCSLVEAKNYVESLR